MNTLRELVAKWREYGERSIMQEAYTALGEARGYRNCATELEAVAEEGSNNNAKEELDAIDELCGPRQPDDATSVFCRISHKLRAAAPSLHKEGLPLQRTLPDEQFKGVVVEAIGRAQVISREILEKLFDEYVPLRPMHPEAKGYMFEMLTVELNEAASPAGRASDGQHDKLAHSGSCGDGCVLQSTMAMIFTTAQDVMREVSGGARAGQQKRSGTRQDRPLLSSQRVQERTSRETEVKRH